MYISSSNKKLIKQWEKEKTKLSSLNKSEMINYIFKNFHTTKRKATEWIESIESYDQNIISDNILKKEYVIPYLSTKTGHKIYEQIKNIDEIYTIYNTLKDFGYSEFIINKLVEEFGFETLDRIYHNPYLPTNYKMSFEDCDAISARFILRREKNS